MFRIPKPHHHRSSGQARLTLQGRHVYLGKWGSPEAEMAYKRLVANLAAAGVTAPRRDSTVLEITAAYLTHAQDYYHGQASTLVRIRAAMKFVLELHADVQAAQFGPLALMAVRQRMVEHGWCRSMVNRCVSCVKRCFKWAASRELVPGELWHRLASVEGLKRGRTSAPEPAPVTPIGLDEVDKALPHLAPPVATMVRLQLLTGMRPGEVVRMAAPQIDRRGPEGCWVYRPQHHKGAWRGTKKEVLLGPKAQELLAPYLLRFPDGFLFRPEEAMAWHQEQKRAKRKTKVQPSQVDRSKGRPKKKLQERYDRDSYRRAISYACKKAGIDAWSPHRIRHTRATQIRQSFSLDEARAVLGHASADITEIYALRDSTMAAKVMRQIG